MRSTLVEAPQRNSIVARLLPEPTLLVALPVDDEALRADGPHGARLAFSPVAGRRDRRVGSRRRDAAVLVHLWGRPDVGGAAQGAHAGHAPVVGGGGDVDPVKRFACSLVCGFADRTPGGRRACVRDPRTS